MKNVSGLSGGLHFSTHIHIHSASFRADIQYKLSENRNAFSSPGQKTSLTQETELLESLLQEVEHQVSDPKLVQGRYLSGDAHLFSTYDLEEDVVCFDACFFLCVLV